MDGRINSFQSLGTVDGPGVRFVVFMQGCRLRCPYCHNPETWDENGGNVFSSDEVFEKILRYKGYFGKDGGVTVSGGEPLLQSEFVRDLFVKCKAAGVSTALDTAGFMMNDSVLSLLDVTDIVLLDIKFSDDEKYKKYIGLSLNSVENFLRATQEKQNRVIIRQVIIPGINDSPQDIKQLGKIIAKYSCIEKAELLPFRKLCIEKYKNMGLEFPFKDTDEMKDSKAEELQKLLK